MIIDLYHDTACPWCRIGKQHLKMALAQWQSDEPVTVRYHTFFLNDQIPPEGADFRPYMIAKGNGQVPLEQFFDAPRRMGAQVGITFNFEAIESAPNTLLSHRVIALTPDAKKEQIIDAIYAAYFEHGQDIGDLEVLLKLAADNGLDSDQLRQQLAEGAAEAEVIMDARNAHQIGISGVPFFVINNAVGFSGAQPPEVILRAFEHPQVKAAQIKEVE